MCSCFIRLLEKNGLTRPRAYHPKVPLFYPHFRAKKTRILRGEQQKFTFPFPDGRHPEKCTKEVGGKIDEREFRKNDNLSASFLICGRYATICRKGFLPSLVSSIAKWMVRGLCLATEYSFPRYRYTVPRVCERWTHGRDYNPILSTVRAKRCGAIKTIFSP